jgi:hypothetical protein
MISCKNVAKLPMSDELSAQSWWRRMEVRLHLSMCDLCSRLARQINAAFRRPADARLGGAG